MNQNSLKKIAIIDVDGTLINGQIQQKLLNFFRKKGLIGIVYFVRINIWFVLYKLGFSKNIETIMNYGIAYLKDKPIINIDKIVTEFIKEVVIPDIFPKSFELISKLKNDNYSIIILSSAIDIVIKHIATLFSADDYICTKTEIHGDVYAGNIYGKIIYEQVKVTELAKYFKYHGYTLDNSVAYADHESDIPLLKYVGKSFIVNPNKHMIKMAIKEGLGIIYTI